MTVTHQVDLCGAGGSQNLLDLGEQLFTAHFRAVCSGDLHHINPGAVNALNVAATIVSTPCSAGTDVAGFASPHASAKNKIPAKPNNFLFMILPSDNIF